MPLPSGASVDSASAPMSEWCLWHWSTTLMYTAWPQRSLLWDTSMHGVVKCWLPAAWLPACTVVVTMLGAWRV